MSTHSDFAIIGAGVVGLTVARELRLRYPTARITIFEKEDALGAHASGRNSGVIHRGIYYPPASLKAKVCVEGAKLMVEYCKERDVPHKMVGKIILPVNEAEDQQLDRLFEQSKTNGAQVEIIDRKQILDLEPDCAPMSRALYSPTTACVDSVAFLKAIESEIRTKNVTILYGHQLKAVDAKKQTLFVNGEHHHYGTLVNTAGTFADKVAHMCGAGLKYSLLPFRGSYVELSSKSRIKIRGNIYPVPDLRQPFLGVHFTKSVTGKVYVGPTAMPAFGRESYRMFQNVDYKSVPWLGGVLLKQYFRNIQGFRTFVHAELRRLRKSKFFDEARAMVPGLEHHDLVPSKKAGIRAQLYDRSEGKLVMDFVVERGPHEIHVLNAVSPGFTSSMSFAKYVADYV